MIDTGTAASLQTPTSSQGDHATERSKEPTGRELGESSVQGHEVVSRVERSEDETAPLVLDPAPSTSDLVVSEESLIPILGVSDANPTTPLGVKESGSGPVDLLELSDSSAEEEGGEKSDERVPGDNPQGTEEGVVDEVENPPALTTDEARGAPNRLAARVAEGDLDRLDVKNELGSWGIYRRQQPISFRLVAARVSLRMATDACAAAPRAPYVWLHVQDTCRTPPLLPHVRMHAWSACKTPHQYTHVDQHASVACAETPRAWSLHLVLLCVRLHGLLPCTATPRASVDTQLLRWVERSEDETAPLVLDPALSMANLVISEESLIPILGVSDANPTPLLGSGPVDLLELSDSSAEEEGGEKSDEQIPWDNPQGTEEGVVDEVENPPASTTDEAGGALDQLEARVAEEDLDCVEN
ncbi:hypothetical protein F2Q69_00045941 [Brassica cretica]|uniref:Uncharacterized protein n=1 Tax=Brassica cretica TaxID=69181 RepID=A0A8S9PV43_BRACR|nr:hypothetical protein F2Q69_00045941 [Brassica cretica]